MLNDIISDLFSFESVFDSCRHFLGSKSVGGKSAGGGRYQIPIQISNTMKAGIDASMMIHTFGRLIGAFGGSCGM